MCVSDPASMTLKHIEQRRRIRSFMDRPVFEEVIVN
jgi:hypothetical protein